MSHADSPKVQSARQKADAGYYDRPEVIDAALDRLAADLDAMPHAVVDAADLADIIGDEMEGILQTRPFTDEWGGEDNVFRSCVREVGVELYRLLVGVSFAANWHVVRALVPALDRVCTLAVCFVSEVER